MGDRETRDGLDDALAVVLETATYNMRLEGLLCALEHDRVPLWWASFVLIEHPELLTP